jgi:hypothetical protein
MGWFLVIIGVLMFASIEHKGACTTASAFTVLVYCITALTIIAFGVAVNLGLSAK